MRKRKQILFVITLLLLYPAVSTAAPVTCPSGSRPLLRILDYWRLNVPGPVPSEDRRSVTICTGGKVIAARVGGPAGHLVPTEGALSVGSASASAMSALRETMSTVRIGNFKTCRFLITHGIDVVEDITWFGGGTRTNRFTISSLDPALPPCKNNGGLLLFVAIQEVIDSSEGVAAVDGGS